MSCNASIFGSVYLEVSFLWLYLITFYPNHREISDQRGLQETPPINKIGAPTGPRSVQRLHLLSQPWNDLQVSSVSTIWNMAFYFVILGISGTERSERRNRRSGMRNRAGFKRNKGYLLFWQLLTVSPVGLFQADNKGETGVMGFPGLRVSIDTFPQLSSSSFLLTEAVLNVLGATWCRGKPRNKGTIRIRIIHSSNHLNLSDEM